MISKSMEDKQVYKIMAREREVSGDGKYEKVCTLNSTRSSQIPHGNLLYYLTYRTKSFLCGNEGKKYYGLYDTLKAHCKWQKGIGSEDFSLVMCSELYHRSDSNTKTSSMNCEIWFFPKTEI